VLRECLRTLEAQTFRDFETIVVDNGSTDGTAAMLAAEFPGARLMPLPENRGFAVATNVGLRAARGAVLVCLNNDVEAEPDWLAALVRVLDTRPDIGFVASKMLNAHQPELIDAAGDAMSLLPWNGFRARAFQLADWALTLLGVPAGEEIVLIATRR
jgi:GT2 family glycosyltransferase